MKLQNVSWVYEEGTVIAETTQGATRYPKEALAFLSRAKRLGVDKSVLYKSFSYKGATYKILGYSPYSSIVISKGPIIILADGKLEKCTLEFMRKFVYETNPELAL